MEDNGRYHGFYPRLLYYDEPTPKHIEIDKGSATLTSWILWNLVVFYYHDGIEHVESWKKIAEEYPTIMSPFTIAAVNFILNDAASFCNKHAVPNPRKSGNMMPLPIDEYPVMFDNLENYLAEIAWGNKNKSIMNSEVLPMLINSFETYEDIVARVDFSEPEISDIDSAISNVIASLPEEVEKYKSGKTALINRFTGEVLRLLGKKADVKIVRKRLELALS
jgi:Asp-tRNA(Asn)/Glu-tRNA(Gln) amidotransferase B subunit